MQILYHKSTKLTIPQKFFIERSIELLYRSSIDSYRVRVKNPKTILKELSDTVIAYERNQVKHFVAIASQTEGKFALKDEALDALDLDPNYLDFQSFSKSYFHAQLKTLSEKNYKGIKDCLSILIQENVTYLNKVLQGLEQLLTENVVESDQILTILNRIDITLGILYTELLESGFSKGFLYRFINGVFVNALDNTKTFTESFELFKRRIQATENTYSIVFRIDTTHKVRDAFATIGKNTKVCSSLNDLYHLTGNKEFDNFTAPRDNRCYVKCHVVAPDHLSALKKAKASLAENLDILNLGFGDEHISIHSRVLVMDEQNPNGAKFQESKNFLDGKYKVAKEHYQSFIDKLPIIISKLNITRETKEKIKSAIRYLRLGNESTEVEHKFINYWIGIEYLFSNYESNNTINRIKEYLVSCHSLGYVKRNAFDFHKSVSKLGPDELALITTYTARPTDCLRNRRFYSEVSSQMLSNHPLIGYRAHKLGTILHSTESKKSIKEYVEKHRKNLIIHITRIYRLRNEIIHDAATNTNNENIASNLRYYLTFILNGLIAYLCQTDKNDSSIEDYFVLNEIYLGNLTHNGWQLNDLLDVHTPIDFIH